MFAKLNNGQLQKYPYTLGMLRKDNANISFPKVLDDATLARFELVKVSPTPRPEYDHTKDFNVTAELVNGSWVEAWIATDVSAEEVDNRTANQASNVRADRNNRLAETDWTQVLDAPVDQTAWTNYRQALRDIPQQAGFPWEVTWPEEPVVEDGKIYQVTMRQARLALLQQGFLSQVDAALAAIPDETERTKAQIEWEYATVVERNAQLTLALGAAMGLTEDQLDQLFIFAGTL